MLRVFLPDKMSNIESSRGESERTQMREKKITIPISISCKDTLFCLLFLLVSFFSLRAVALLGEGGFIYECMYVSINSNYESGNLQFHLDSRMNVLLTASAYGEELFQD